MAAKITPLLDKDDNIIYPPTKAKVVYMSDNTTNAEDAINSAKTDASNAKTAADKAAAAVASKATTSIYSASVGTTWSGSEAPYTQTIAVSGILSTDTPIVDVNLASIAYADKSAVIEDYAKIYRITTADGSITVYSDDVTSVAVPLQLKVVR